MQKNLRFKTNSRHIGQLGRELVTDFVTALVELVKNAYDADAGRVMIKIEDANTPNSRIVIADTGCGMTQSEFENRWMVIGTSNKVSNPYTPNGRRKAGKKGIGRFSVERLAERVSIYSYTEEESYKVSINWNKFEEISIDGLKQRIKILRNKRDTAAAKYLANQLEYYLSLPLTGDDKKEQEYVRKTAGEICENYEYAFEGLYLDIIEKNVLPILKKQEKVELKLEEIENPLTEIEKREEERSYQILKELWDGKKNGANCTGIVMVLERLRDNWKQKDIDKLQKELRLLVAPEFIEKDPFHIELIADQFEIPEELSVNSILDLAFAKVEARICNGGRDSQIIYKDIQGHSEKEEETYEEPLICGDMTFELYYFLRDAHHLTNETYAYRLAVQVLNIYSGVKIYRDNFRVKPYGEIGNDWLGLDKAKTSDTHGYRVGNNQTIGVIKISDEQNPLLIDATNREGLIENEAYEQLKEFILKSMYLISRIRKKIADDELKQKLEKEEEKKKEEKKKEKEHKKKQDAYYNKIEQLLVAEAEKTRSGNYVLHVIQEWKKNDERFQEEKEKSSEQRENAYREYIDYQETELSMYKNLATLGILTGNFGHETQDVVSRIGGTLSYYQELAEILNMESFKQVTKNVVSDFERISGYSAMIVEFLRKKKRNPETELNFGMVLDGICKLYLPMLKPFDIQMQWNSRSDIVMTMRQIDLESIIINMITNAFEQVKERSNRKIQIQFTEDDETIELLFEDSGVGVPEPEREKIFHAFYTTKEDDGIGLGLNIVKDIVSSYDGTIYVMDSKELGGAKFVVHFMKKETT